MANYAKAEMEKRKITVNRLQLVEVLKSNKERHIATYEEALKGYKEEALAKLEHDAEVARQVLEKTVKKVRSELEEFDPDKIGMFGDSFILIKQVVMNLPLPRCYAAEYDAAIAMAAWDTRDELELSFAEFQCFVRDEWDWKGSFEAVVKNYTKVI